MSSTGRHRRRADRVTHALLVGIDVGTSACKVNVLDLDGVERAQGRCALPWRRRGGGTELAAADAMASIERAVRIAMDQVVGDQVVGVGVTSMAEAGYPLDHRDRPLAPAMAWHDERAAGELGALGEDLGDLVAVTGLRVNARPPLVRLRWQLREGHVRQRPALWLNMAEYVVRALGGDQVTEPSLASRSGWFDVTHGTWWHDALAWSGCDEDLLPELCDAGTPAGTVSRVASPLAGAVLTVAGHDHLAASVGAGVVTPGPIVDSCGTAEVLLRAMNDAPSSQLRQRAARLGFTSGRHVVPGLHALIGGFPSGALLDRAARALGYAGPADADAGVVGGGQDDADDPPLDLDALSELVTSWESGGRASDRPAPSAWRHVVRSIGAHAGEVLGRLEELSGPRTRVLTVGGSAGGSLIAEARRAALAPLSRPAVAEAASRGAALIAGVAAGIYPQVAAVPSPAVDPVEEGAT